MLEFPAEVFAQLTDDGSSDVTPFDILFSSKCKDVYEMTRPLLVEKWTKKRGYNHTEVCGVCLLRQRQTGVDITLLNLFYACATLTQNTVLDAMTCLNVLYGRNACQNLSPKDIYFHFFLNHCDTKKGVFDCPSYTPVADFLCKLHHSITYDVSEVDELAYFISMITVETYVACECNESKHVLKVIHDGRDKMDKPRTDVAGGGDDDDDDNECGLFIPSHTSETATHKVRWENSYKWDYVADNVDPEDGIIDLTKQDAGDDDGAVQQLAINCLKVFSTCKVCTSMMAVGNDEKIAELERLVTTYCEFTNIHTAVQMACKTLGLPPSDADEITAHYTTASCELNRLRHIHFYSLVKQPAALMNPISTQHLFMELFSCKRSYLCPSYHLACVCDKVSGLDTSNMKRTRRETISRWSKRVLERHRPNYRTSKFKKVRV